MPGKLIPILLAGGAVAYILEEDKPKLVAPNKLSATGGTIVPGSQPGSSVNPVQPTGESMSVGQLNELHSLQSNIAAPPSGGTPSAAPEPLSCATGNVTSIDPGLQQKLNLIDVWAMTIYSAQLSAGAKQAGAALMNQQYGFDPPLTGGESYQGLTTAVASRFGNQYGNSGYTGVAGAKTDNAQYLSPIVQMYLGKQISDLVNLTVDQLNVWIAAQLAPLTKGGGAGPALACAAKSLANGCIPKVPSCVPGSGALNCLTKPSGCSPTCTTSQNCVLACTP